LITLLHTSSILLMCFFNDFTTEWQAGYREFSISLFQAEIEFSLFCPPLLLTEHSKNRLFEHFWNSHGARVGEVITEEERGGN